MLYLYMSDNNVEILENRPNNILWESCIKLKIPILPDNKLIIVTDTKMNEFKFDNVNNKLYFKELLKSNLQKCVRRKKPESAIRTAFLMMKNNMNELLRRLIIIIAEDSLIHNNMLYCMWLYIASSKGYKLSYTQIINILNIVYQTSISNYYDINITDTNFESDILFKYYKDKHIDDCRLAMLLRLCYGGMKGDMQLLKSFNRIWIERSNNNLWINFIYEYWNHINTYNIETIFNINEYNIQNILSFKNTDKIIYSVDFHCLGNKFIDSIKKYHNFNEITIRKTVWYWHSGIQYKQIISDYENYNHLNLNAIDLNRYEGMKNTEKVWLNIKNTVEKIALYYWR